MSKLDPSRNVHRGLDLHCQLTLTLPSNERACTCVGFWTVAGCCEFCRSRQSKGYVVIGRRAAAMIDHHMQVADEVRAMMPEPQLQYYETARMLVLRSGGKRHQPRLAGAIPDPVYRPLMTKVAGMSLPPSRVVIP